MQKPVVLCVVTSDKGLCCRAWSQVRVHALRAGLATHFPWEGNVSAPIVPGLGDSFLHPLREPPPSATSPHVSKYYPWSKGRTLKDGVYTHSLLLESREKWGVFFPYGKFQHSAYYGSEIVIFYNVTEVRFLLVKDVEVWTASALSVSGNTNMAI